MKQLLLVFLGGGIGSSLRYLVGRLFASGTTGFPWATFTVNIIGSFIIGLVLGFALKNNSFSQNTVLFLATGLCGGFTTFSAFAYENQVFLKSGDYGSFALYTISSLALGIIAVIIGLWLAKAANVL